MCLLLQRMSEDRHGAAAARGAHNSEVTGSKPVAGIHFFSFFKDLFFPQGSVRLLVVIRP
jgi:hypothetical protein